MMSKFLPLSSLRHIKKNRLYSLAIKFSDSSLKEISTADAVRSHQTNPLELSNSKPRSDILVRPKLRISDILAMKDGSLFTISEDATIDEAISHVVKQNVSCCLTLDCNGEVSGIFTARDILKFIQSTKSNGGGRNRGGQNCKMLANEMLSPTVSDIIVRKEKLVYCSPDDTVRQCREIMFQLRIRNLPVIVNNELLGIVSIQDLADSAFSLSDTGGKKGFIHNVTGRKGLPQGTKLIEDTKLHAEAGTVPGGIGIKNQVKLALDVASYALPHPFKHEGGVASSRRNYGASELSTDLAYCEGIKRAANFASQP
jgi:CBS domain-containing protein